MGRNGRVWKATQAIMNTSLMATSHFFHRARQASSNFILGDALNMLELAEWNLVVTAAAICKRQDLLCFARFHCLALVQKPRCLQFAL